MHQILQLTLPPQTALDDVALRQYIIQHLRIADDHELLVRKIKQSIDARSKQVKVSLQAEVFVGEPPTPVISYQKDYPNVSQKSAVVIVGAGPAGLFAA
ncbi:MAG: FAD-binding protein, partial [Runella zeae]